jgi:hypothetical protein
MKDVMNIFGNIPHVKEEPSAQCLLIYELPSVTDRASVRISKTPET